MTLTLTCSSADLATVIEDMRRLAGFRRDGNSVSVPVGLLNAAVRELEEHSQCEAALDDLRADKSARYDGDLAEVEADHELAVTKLKDEIDDLRDIVASFEEQLQNADDEG